MYDQVAARPSSGTAAGSLPSAATDDITSENGRFTAALRDHGRALTNPGMGWTMHFYSNILSNYGSQLEPSDTLDDFPGLSTVYRGFQWAFLEPRGRQIRLGTARHPGAALDRQRQIRRLPRQRDRKLAVPRHAEMGIRRRSDGIRRRRSLPRTRLRRPGIHREGGKLLRAMAERYDRQPARRLRGRRTLRDVGRGPYGHEHAEARPFMGPGNPEKHIDLYCKHFKNTQLCISDDFAGHDAPGSRFPITDYAFSRG